MTKMMKCFPKVSSLIEKKKNGEGDGFGSVTPHWQLNLYSPPLYSVDNDWFSFPLDNHVISQE